MLCRNLLAWTMLLGVGLSALQNVGAQQESAPAADRCQVLMDLPLGTQVTIDSRDYGEQSNFDFNDLTPGQVYPSRVALRFHSGERLDRTVLIQGGRRIRLAELDPKEPRPEMVLQQGHFKGCNSVAYSHDGHMIASGSDDGTIKLWSAVDGRFLKTLTGHKDSVRRIAFSPNGRTIASASWDKTVKVWGTTDGRLLRTLAVDEGYVNSVAYSPDGRVLISAGNGIKLWDATDGKLLQTIKPHDGGASCIAFRPGGQTLGLARGGTDETSIKLWDVVNGRLLRILEGHDNAVHDLSFSPDGRTLASASTDHTILVWDATSGELLRALVGHGNSVNGVAFSPNSRRLASASEDGTIKLWDAVDYQLVRTLRSGDEAINCVCYSPDGRTLASGNSNGTIRVWDAADGRLLRTLEAHVEGIEDISYDLNGRMLALARRDKTTKLWDMSGGHLMYTLKGHEEAVHCVAFRPDGRTLASGSLDTTIKFWDTSTGELLRTLQGHASCVNSLAFSPKGDALASSSGSIMLWDATSGQPLQRLGGHGNWAVEDVVFSPDGRTLASAASDDVTLKFWDASGGQLLRTLQGACFERIAYNVDGRVLATIASYKNEIRLYDAINGELLRSLLDGLSFTNQNSSPPENWIRSIAFSPDGRTLTSASQDETLKLWDITDGRLLRTLAGHVNAVEGIAYSPDGDTLAAGGRSGMRLFDPFTGKELCQLHSFDNDDWLVTTPEGLFDGNEGGQQRVFYRVGEGLEIAPVAFYRDSYYRAGLLARLMKGERLLPTSHFKGRMPPKIEIQSPADSSVVDVAETTLRFTLTDQGGGIGPVQVRRDGSTHEVGEAIASTAQSKTYSVQIPLAPGKNRIVVTFRGSDRDLRDEKEVRIICSKGIVRADLYVLAVGVTNYNIKELRRGVSFGAEDARRMSQVFTRRAGELYGNVYSFPLCDADATKDKLKVVCSEIANRAKPEDTLLVFLAGHGKRIGDEFIFLPVNLQQTGQLDVISEGIRTDILFDDYLRGLKAGKRIMVIDACHAGAAIRHFNPEKATRGDSYSMQDLVAKLAHDRGIYTLAAASEDETAEELPELQHGALTYTLLAALGEVDFGPLKDKKIVANEITVGDWFNFATKHLPFVAPDQTPKDAKDPDAANFPLLRATQ